MRRILFFILLMIVFSTACFPKVSTEVPIPLEDKEGLDKSNSEEPQTFSYLYSGELTTLNYLKSNSSNEIAIASNLIDGLVEYDRYGLAKPALAVDWIVSDDKMVWTFKLRDDVYWYTVDGYTFAKVIAQDFVESIKYILNPDNKSSTANIVYGVIKNAEKYYNGEIKNFSEVGVKSIDKYTLEYTLEKATPYFLSMISHPCFLPVNGEFLNEVETNLQLIIITCFIMVLTY